MPESSPIAVQGLLLIEFEVEKPEQAVVIAEKVEWNGCRGRAWQRNAFLNNGLNTTIDRLFGLGGTAISHIGVNSAATQVTAAQLFLNGASGGTAANTIIKALSPAATRTNQTGTGGATFANADFTSGVFIIRRVGFLNASTDASGAVQDIIGGDGTNSPYNKTFVVDFTNAGTFSMTPQIAVTATAV